MPRVSAPKFTICPKDAEYLRSLDAASKLARKCEYLCTSGGRFIICYECNCGKYVYYAVDRFTGKFSWVGERSFKLTETSFAREFLNALVKSVWYTGCFNRVKGGGQVRQSVWITVPKG